MRQSPMRLGTSTTWGGCTVELNPLQWVLHFNTLTMYFDISTLDGRASYKLMTATVVPRPIAWVVTLDATGTPNAAPFSFFNCFSGVVPTVAMGMGLREDRAKDSLANICANPEFVINLVSEELVTAMNITAIDFPPGRNELLEAGLATAPSQKIQTPRIAASPVALECVMTQVVDIGGNGSMVIANVVALHVRDDAVINAAKCYIDTAKLNLVGRMESPGWYTRTADRFKLPPIPLADWDKSRLGQSTE